MEKVSKATIRLWMPNKLIKFLKKNGALTSFIDETWKRNEYNPRLKEFLSYNNAIGWVFRWSCTKKGGEYWSNLNNKYVEEHGNY